MKTNHLSRPHAVRWLSLASSGLLLGGFARADVLELKKGQAVSIPPGTLLQFQLQQPLTVSLAG